MSSEHYVIATIAYNDETLTIWRGRYFHSPARTGVVADADTGEPYADISVNLDSFEPTSAEHFFVKDHSPSRGLVERLVKLGIIAPTQRNVVYGPFGATATEYTFCTT